MSVVRWFGSLVLLVAVLGTGAWLARWKRHQIAANEAANAHPPEPIEAITVAVAEQRDHLRTTTSIGTVTALQSITLRNEIAGTVRESKLVPGEVVEADTLLVALDVSVEEAEQKAQQAQVALAESMLGRMERASATHGASEADVDRARAERDVAVAQVARTQAIIARKTIRAPFRARVGMSDVHAGQFLKEGTELTTLQGVDDAVHVEFSVAQAVAAGLSPGDAVDVVRSGDETPIAAKIVALDARVDPMTRNEMVRARVEGRHGLTPGASVRVRVPIGAPRSAVVVPANALRKGPAGDHVFVVAPDASGNLRARQRPVRGGTLLGDVVLVEEGLAAGEQVAAAGSFKLHEGELVSVKQESGSGEAR